MQKAALLAAGVPEEWIYMDVESGRKPKRTGLINALKACRRGGELLFWKLDRLGRDVAEVILTAKRLDERGVRFRSLTEPHINTDARKTAAGNAFFVMTAMFAEMESYLIAERTRAGQKAAKARGVKFGRKTFAELYLETGKVAEFQRDLRESGGTIEAVRKRQKIPLGTFKKWRDVFMGTSTLDIDEVTG